MENRKERGRAGETAAASFLAEQGVQILYRNYTCRQGEIDLKNEKKSSAGKSLRGGGLAEAAEDLPGI